MPLVSVLLPVYNAANDLPRALNSLLGQTFTDFEIIAIDDGSSDNSGRMLDEYATRDARLRVFHQANAGALGQVLNRAADLASGKYLARQDADDASASTRLEQQVQYLENHPQTGLCGTWTWYIDNELGPLFSYELPDKPELIVHFMETGQNPLVHGSIMLRKELFQAIGGYRGSYSEDFDLWLRLSEITRLGMVTSLGYYYWRSIGGINSGANLRQKALNRLILRLHQERISQGKEISNWTAEYATILSVNASEAQPEERTASIHYARAIYLLRQGRWQAYKSELAKASHAQGPYAQKAKRQLALSPLAPLLRLAYRLAIRKEPFYYSRPLKSDNALPNFFQPN